jgi:hypothetical protein
MFMIDGSRLACLVVSVRYGNEEKFDASKRASAM